MAKEHKLKIKYSYFQKVESGEKTFEIRKNDRDYQVGDIIHFVPIGDEHPIVIPHNENSYRITYVFNGGEYGLSYDYCVFSIEKVTEKSHDERHILKYCISLMQEMVDEFAEWYKLQHGEDAINELDDEEIFCIRKSYFRIVQELFLFNTNHCGGNSTRAKCDQLGVDWGEEVSFDWSDEE